VPSWSGDKFTAMFLIKYLPGGFVLAMLATVALASFFPAHGAGTAFFEALTTTAIALLFFLHGAKLSREAILAGIGHWRLHLLVLCSTFALFPMLGWVLRPLLSHLTTPELYLGILYLCVLPATVQSAIAFTSMARGNISAAICSASLSTLLGVFITPILVQLFVLPGAGAGSTLDSIVRILLQLMAPFFVGHLLRPWIGEWVRRRAKTLKFVDQGSILLVVFTAFSAAVMENLWGQIGPWDFVGLLITCLVVLALALCSTTWLARRLGFNKADEITIVFCGSKKSLASGIPMAKVLFAPQVVGAIVLPLMLFHQIQLMVCAVLAQRYAKRPEDQ
jgi:solute carrier family 10 (sodium/bile acid cotransporter), member 7